MLLRNPKNTIKRYLNIFSAHFSLFRSVTYTVRQYHVTDYRVDFSNFVLCYSKRVENSTTRATMCSPVLHVRIRVGLLREETSALDSDCRKCIQSRALVPFRVSAHSRETERHKRRFGSRGDAAHRGLLAAAGPQEVRQGHPRGATPGKQGEGASGKKQVLATKSGTATSW